MLTGASALLPSIVGAIGAAIPIVLGAIVVGTLASAVYNFIKEKVDYNST